MFETDFALQKLAHDLRTPLTALKMAASLLAARRGKKADPDEAVLLQTLQRNIVRLEQLISDFSAAADHARRREAVG